MKFNNIHLFLFLVTMISCTQEKAVDYSRLKGPYLGQKPPGRTPEVFAPGILSYDKIGAFCSVFTPDGNEFYYVRFIKDEEGSGRIYWTRRVNNIWAEPEPVPFGSDYPENDMRISPDGSKMFWRSWRPLPGKSNKEDRSCIWYSNRKEDGWNKPQPLKCVDEYFRAGYLDVTNNGTLYFPTRREDGYGEGDIYRSRYINGAYTMPENLGSTINTPYSEGDLCVDPDESFLIVSCWNRPDNRGVSDFYISFRNSNGEWSGLKNMGEPINSDLEENCPTLSTDGKYFLFNRRNPVTGESNIYWVDTEFIEDFRPKDDFPVLKGPYLGQKPPEMTPEIFAPGIISTDGGEFNSVFSPDGNEFYYSQTNKEKKKDQIMYMKRVNNMWTKPAIAPFSGEYDDCDMSISYDGQRFFFISIGRILPDSNTPTKRNYMWYMEKTQTGWGEPQLLEYPGNVGGVYPISTDNGTLYFSSRLEENFGGADIYRSQFVSGSYAAPENLGSAINSKYSESDTFVAPDESFLIVTCWERPENIGGGKSDLYLSFRKRDGSWTTLKNMGKLINTEYIEFCPMLSPDGKYFFFSSDRTDVDECYIYWMDAKIIEEFKPDDLK